MLLSPLVNTRLEIEEVTDELGLIELELEWQSLLERAGDPTPFQSWEWIWAWWKHHGHGRLWILVARDRGVLVAILPLTITRYRGTPLRQVRFAGAPLSDIQEPLVAPAYEARAAQAFLAHVLDAAHLWDLCDLNDQRKGSALTVAALPAGSRVTLEHHRTCACLALPASWDALLATLGSHMRSNVKRRRKKLVAGFATVEIAAPDHQTLPAMMEDLFRLHNRRWRKRGAPGAFADEHTRRFHQEVAWRFLERGWLRLYVLRLDGQARGAFYGFQYRRRVYHYLSGFDHEVRRLAPGIVLMAHAIERAIGEGATQFDMLRGDESYKYYWKPAERETQRMLIGHPSVRSSMALRAHRLERYLERHGVAMQKRLWGERPLRQGPTAVARAAALRR